MAELIAVVHVKDTDGNTRIFGPGDDVPKWAADLIVNPKAWDGEPEEKASKPFSLLNKTELTAVAEHERIDISAATTNDEIRAAIKSARDSK